MQITFKALEFGQSYERPLWHPIEFLWGWITNPVRIGPESLLDVLNIL
mgnify:CR=1